MSTSAIGGSGSMIDVNGIVSGLMAIEQRPLQTIKSRISATQLSVSSMSEVKGLVDAAYSAANAIKSPLLLGGKSVTSSNEGRVKVSVSNPALAGVGSIPISPARLAGTQRSTLAGFTSATDALSATDFGELTVSIPQSSTLLEDADGDGQGDALSPVRILMGGRTLTQIRDDINAQLAGKVSASIINTGDSGVGYILVLSGAKTGADADFTLALDTTTLNNLGSSGLRLGADAAEQASQTLATNVVETIFYDASASDAEATLYAGTSGAITVKSANNIFTDAVPGLQFELTSGPVQGESNVANITVVDNTAEVEAKLSTFATAFSDLIKRLGVLTKPGSADKQAGPLASNSGVLGLTSSLLASYSKGLTLSDSRTYTTTSGTVIGTSANPIAWSTIGLKMARDGAVTLDTSIFRSAMSSGLGVSVRAGFDADLIGVLESFRSSNGGLLGTIQTIELSLSSLKTRQTEFEARLERTRQGLVKKYAALDAKLVQMNQMSTNVRSALAGLSV